jgi:hypothetical protein
MSSHAIATERFQPKVIKIKNGVPTIIEWHGQRYILEHKNQFRCNSKMIQKSNSKIG